MQVNIALLPLPLALTVQYASAVLHTVVLHQVNLGLFRAALENFKCVFQAYADFAYGHMPQFADNSSVHQVLLPMLHQRCHSDFERYVMA